LKKISYILFLVISFACYANIFAAPKTIVKDSVAPAKLKIDPSIENEIFSDEAYQYKDIKAQGEKESFLSWLLKKLFGNSSPETIDNFWNIVKIILVVLFIVGLVWLTLKMNGGKLFKGESAKASVFTDITEEISTIDVDKLISEAVSKSDFKTAFRYCYLRSLQLMNDKKLIDWKPFKTNYEYFSEFKSERTKPLFKQLYMGFEYMWYGDGHITKEVFEDYKKEFDKFNQQLGA
jgi:hypothetical protein